MQSVRTQKEQTKISVAAIRSTIIDVINKANSGHPGMALDATPAIYALYRDHLIADPKDPSWINRDRLIYSAGHTSALIYTMLHVAGYDVSMEDLKEFRQYGSKTPGHPEYGHTAGIDATAGPLGQGIAQAVGVAMAERAVAASYPDGSKIMNHYTYVLCGDGCLEEGISQEAISLAGHQKLNKLILIYDENGSTLDGPTSNSLSENVKLRFLSSEWNVFEVMDGNSVDAISKKIGEAKKSKDYPTMILVHTKIGFGSKFEGQSKTHGAPLGQEDGAYAKKRYGYEEPEFTILDSVYEDLRSTFLARGQEAHKAHETACKQYAAGHPSEYALFQKAFARDLEGLLPAEGSVELKPSDSSRNVSGKYLIELHKTLPFAFGGSADVAGSVKTAIPGDPNFTPETPMGRNINWGIREFAMASAGNGICLHGGLVPYVGCFAVFADYMKSALRMSCLEKIPAIYLFSHDSIAVGEDGPTHEPIEQLAMLRSIPGMHVFRPCDGRETIASWEEALLSKEHPTAILLSRQNLPLLEKSSKEGVRRGAYKVYEPNEKANLELIATGSEVGLAIEASKILEGKGIHASVVSMPSWEVFEEQDASYKEAVLDLPYERRVSIEMLSTFGWAKYAKHTIGIDTYGASGPCGKLMEAFGFTPDKIAENIERMVA